jgi:hypothetical protein
MPTSVSVSLGPKNKVDILFMVDNSPSMSPKQVALKAAFPSLVSVIKNVPADYHIGVVTSDLGAGMFTINRGQCHPGGDGAQLQAKGAAADPTCGTLGGGLNFIQYNELVKDAMGNPTSNLPTGQDLATTFGCMASVGDLGCGFESQLESVYKALHDNIPTNTGFLRDDAILVVVWLTDEDDDCSADPASDLLDPSGAGMANYGALLSFRGSQYGVACDAPGTTSGPVQTLPYGDSGGPLNNCVPAPNPTGNLAGAPPMGQGKCYDVQRYIDFFTQPKSNGGVKADPSDVILVGITAPETPVQVILANIKAPVGPYQTCPGPVDPSGSGCAVVLQHSCISPANTAFFGDPAVRIRAVINSIANSQHKQNTSICDQDYTSALQSIGTVVGATSSGSGCVAGMFQDPTNPQCTVTLDGNPLPRCDSGMFPCWKIQTSSTCGTQPSLAVDWNGGMQPAGSTLQATCQVLLTM